MLPRKTFPSSKAPTPFSTVLLSRLLVHPKRTLVSVQVSSPDDDRSFVEDLDRRFITFREHARHVLNHSPATCRMYAAGYQNFRTYLLHEQGVVQAPRRAEEIEEWIAWNRKRGCSAISTNTYWRAVRTFFAFRESREGILNPFHGVAMPKFPVPLPKARSADECRRILLSAANYPWLTDFQRVRAVALLGIIIYAGLRRGEVVRLLYSDVDFKDRTLRIVKGKGRYGGTDRTAYVNDDLRDILAAYLRERERERFVCPEFFASLTTRQGLSVGQFIRIARSVRKASGIGFSLHSLRHSFVTLLLQSDVKLHVARDLAGHTDIATTAGYLRVWDDELRREIQKLKL
jgi:integrase